jgi:anti-sigma factor RsiW
MTMHYDLQTLGDYLHGELDANRDAAVHAHLENCAACRAAYDETAAVRDWIRAAAAEDERDFPSIISARVWDEIRSAKPSPFAWLRTGWRPWLAAPIAAAMLFGAYLEVPFFHTAPTLGVAASDLLLEHAAQMADNPLADHGVVVPASTMGSMQPTSALIEAVDTTSIDDSTTDDGR